MDTTITDTALRPIAADGFPTGGRLDRLVLWALGEMRRQLGDGEIWTPTLTFYLLRECAMGDYCNERHYEVLVERSLDRLQAEGLVGRADDSSWQLQPMAAL